ncbi:diacylglycerol kinase [Caryophanon latum]|uniref:Diacylglycerol kinase n=1 Tax=Caryophanon latum TaxID=33977 RepID=A0A1C0YNW0_9BACL|nr:diacylglycerol kinase [Caryophanon latum]OCS88854.1 diacylglycerol kinase [Caryophanon latum]
MTELKRARIIYNPTSGRELFKKHLPEVLEKLEVAGYETSCHATTGEGDATKAAAIAVERGYDIVIAVGGDGTLNEVVAGMSPYEGKLPKLGVIPMGTTNDFARAVQIPRKIEDALDIIIKGETIPVDVGVVDGNRYFINIAAGGRITELTYEVPSKMKTMLGQLAYYLKAVEMAPSIKATHMRIEYDDNVFEGEALMFLCALTNSVGGFEKLAPDASINDGHFTLLILKKCSLAEMLKIVSDAVRGEHLENPNLIYVKAKRVKVESDETVHINLDGEYGGDAPVVFDNLYRHLDVFVSLKDIRDEDRIDM